MKPRSAIALALLLAACGGRERVRELLPDSNHIRNVSMSISGHSYSNEPARYVYKVEFTMPEAFRIRSAVRDVTMTDTLGHDWPMTQMERSDNDERQRFGLTFEPTSNVQIAVVHIDDLDIDVRSGRVTRHKPGA